MATSYGIQRDPIMLDSDDEYDIPQSSPYITQPTQIVARPALGITPAAPSSPGAVIEVPASSPIQRAAPMPAPRPRPVLTMMAPAGTSAAYRTAKRPSTTSIKLPSPKRQREQSTDDDVAALHAIDDSSDNDSPVRGNITPVVFESRPAPLPFSAAKPVSAAPVFSSADLAEAKLMKLTKRLFGFMEEAYTMEQCKEALKASHNDIEDASLYLIDPPKPRKISKGSPSSAASSQSKATSSPRLTSSSKSSEPPRSPPQSKPKARRLVQGRNPRRSPPSSQAQPPAPPTLIDLVSDDNGPDDYSNDESSESEDELTAPGVPAGPSASSTRSGRVLSYLETCSVENLMSMTKVKKDVADLMISRRPFRTLDTAKSVHHMKTTRGKKTRLPVGEDIVERLVEYIKILDAIDLIVRRCEDQGQKVNTSMSLWQMDRMGRIKTKKDVASKALPFACEPKGMQGHCKMQPYQVFGMNWMWQLYSQRFGSILADDMGLGKTCQVVAFITLLVEGQGKGILTGTRPWPNLIVVPPSTLANWEAEFEKFSPGLSVITFSGSQFERDEIALQIQESPEDYHVVLTTYSQLNRHEDIVAMKRIRPHVAVFDEGHKMKNTKAKIYRSLLQIKADWKLLLTGTPVQNNIMEMVALLNFINPQLFEKHMENLQDLFEQRVSLQEVSQGAVLHSDRVNRARTILEPFILQRKKEQVLTDMPAKIRRVAYCELTGPQEIIYRGYESIFRRDKTVKAVKQVGRSNDNNNVWIQLRKSVVHPQLFRRFFDDAKVKKMASTLMDCVDQEILKQPNLGHLTQELMNRSDFELHLWCRDFACLKKFDCPEDSWLDSGKVKKLLELIGQYQKNGDRVLVFSRFATVVTILEECLATAGVNYCVLQGDTQVSERQAIIDNFNQDERITVFLLTTGAGGTGINLTAANKVVIFDQSDNPQDDIQAENRAHRFGQKREVEVIRLLSQGTIDELVYKACQKKLELAAKITGHGEDISAMDVEAEVRNMLKDEAAAAV